MTKRKNLSLIPYHLSRLSGFTLIELMVVISIIGILAGLTLSSYSGAQKQARDSQRRSDLNQYRNSLEVYAGANNLKYPSYANENAYNAATSLYSTHLTSVMSSALIDPVNTGDNIYYYRVNGTTATQYVLYGGLETGGFWEVCSNGKTGKIAAVPTNSTCTVP